MNLLLEDAQKWLGKKVRRSAGSDSARLAGDDSTTLRLFPPGNL